MIDREYDVRAYEEGYRAGKHDAQGEIERLRAALEVTSSDCKEAFAENERLRAALEDIAYPNPLHNEDNLMEIARAALETREAGVSSEGK